MAYRSYLGSLEYALYIARVPLESVRHDPRPAHLSFQQTVPTHPGDLFTERRTVQTPRTCRDLEQQTVHAPTQTDYHPDDLTRSGNLRQRHAGH